MSSINWKQEIKLLAADYEVEEQSELLQCPKCEGGFSKELSLSICKKPEGVLYNCFRASCGIHGFIQSNRVQSVARTNKQKEKPNNPFPADVSEPDWLPEYLSSKFPAMTEDMVLNEGIRYSEERSRVLYPCYNHQGFRYAWLARKYPELGESTRKAIMYMDYKDQEIIHFPVNLDLSDTLYIVEDIPSAIIANEFVSCISILGTSLSPNNVRLITKLGVRNLVVALDPDAVQTATKIVKEYRLDFDTARVLYTPKDIKDMTKEELNAYLGDKK